MTVTGTRGPATGVPAARRDPRGVPLPDRTAARYRRSPGRRLACAAQSANWASSNSPSWISR